MTIPDYQTTMLPLLTIAGDGHQHAMDDAVQRLIKHFQLTAEEQVELLPSGREAIFHNRVGWARTYLKKAGLLESPERGAFRITERGREVLRRKPSAITTKYLEQFLEFQAFQNASRGPALNPSPKNGNLQTPEELLETSYQRLHETVVQELLERVKQSSPQFFERLVVELLVSMGYGGSLQDAGSAIGGSGDGGIDGIIKEDRLGLDVIYIQAKRWGQTVGRPVVQAFAGSLEGQRARKGVLITTSQFSPEAKDYLTHIEKRIVLIDGEQLAQYMMDFGLGVAEIATYHVKRIDSDYFDES